VADVFLERLGLTWGLRYVDVGCGTGALTSRIVATCTPASVIGIDPSDGFVVRAVESVVSDVARFQTGSADALPLDDDAVDMVVSALADNFVPDRPAALAEFRRVCASGGSVAFYVWDCPSGGVGFIDEFWNPAARLDPDAASLDEAGRFPFCTDTALAAEAVAAGWQEVTAEAIEVSTPFADGEEFWRPFTLGAGPAPGYLASLSPDHQERLRASLTEGLDGRTKELTACAWAVTSINP